MVEYSSGYGKEKEAALPFSAFRFKAFEDETIHDLALVATVLVSAEIIT
jgi:hypothetical protein